MPFSRPWVGGSALLAGVAALLLAGASSPAGAATFYVDRANPNCTSSGPNAGTELTPYCTIQTAVNQRGVAGNTIIVRPGIYREQVSLTSGAAGSPLVLQAAGPGVIIDGSDDYTTPAQWTLLSGDVWLASTVTWDPLQVFLDGARTDSSVVDPALLPARSYRWVSGVGLYVNAGGGNPATHQAMIGRRRFGITLPARSFVTVDGFEITRTEDRGVNMSAGCTSITISHNRISFTNKMGIQAVGGSGIVISSNTVSDANDHGISFINGVTASIIEDNETFRNALPTQRASNGIHLFGCPANTIRRNRAHDNQDSGIHIQSGSNDCILYLNRSWNNGDHGYDHLAATGTIHVGDVAYNNSRDGFSVEGISTGTQVHNCIGVNNGVTTSEANLYVDTGSIPGFVSNHNIFWNSGGQPPLKWMTQLYPSLAAYRLVSNQDAQSLEADPKFVNAAIGDFHLLSGSPAIDNANSGAPNWPALDADGLDRVDVPAVANTGIGPVTFADRGAFEFRGTPPHGVIGTPNGNVTIVAGQSVNFTGTGTDPDNNVPLSYAWDFGGGATNSTAEDPGAVVFAATGVYTVTFTVTDGSGFADATPDTRTITVNLGPTAALSVTPSSGNAPLSVTANASGSVPGSAPIVSYRFDFGDGTVVGPQPGATATHVYAAGSWTASVTVTDNLGNAGTASATVVASGGATQTNLVGNPSFETNTTGWIGFQGGSLTRVQGGLDGNFALQITGPFSTASFGVDDSPSWVGSTAGAAVLYRFSAWVRSASHTGNVRIRVREFSGNNNVRQTRETPEIVLSTTWQRLTLDFVTLLAGTRLDFQIIDRPRVQREVFLVDSVSIVRPDLQVNTPPVARLTVTPSSGLAPLAVTADASASTDTESASLPYRFAFGDGTVVGPQPGAVATHTYAAGNWACTVTVTDGGSLTDTTAVPVSATAPPPGTCVNLATNPSFETGIAGWKGVGGTIAQVPGGSAGSFACRVTGPATLSSFYIEDSPRTISSSTAGVLYRFGASVRSELEHVRLKSSIKDYVGGIKIGQLQTPETTLSPSWQRLEIAYTPVQAGSEIYFIVKDSPAAVSESFDLDDVSICGGSPPAPGPIAALVVTPSNGTDPLPVTANASGSTVTGGTIVSYRFDFGDGTVVGPQPGATATHTYAAGNWTCTVTVTDNANRTSTATAPVTVVVPGVNQAPNGVINTPTTAVSILVGQSVNFSATATDPDNNLPLAFLWNFSGASANSSAEDPGSIRSEGRRVGK